MADFYWCMECTHFTKRKRKKRTKKDTTKNKLIWLGNWVFNTTAKPCWWKNGSFWHTLYVSHVKVQLGARNEMKTVSRTGTLSVPAKREQWPHQKPLMEVRWNVLAVCRISLFWNQFILFYKDICSWWEFCHCDLLSLYHHYISLGILS